MLKLLPTTELNRFKNEKCGVIYCLTATSYNVECCVCFQKVLFDEFREHFRRLHLLPDQEKEDVDPIKTEIVERSPEQCDVTETIVPEWTIDVKSIEFEEYQIAELPSEHESGSSSEHTHQQNINELLPFSCTQCSRAYKWKKTLVRHMRAKHNAPRPNKLKKHSKSARNLRFRDQFRKNDCQNKAPTSRCNSPVEDSAAHHDTEKTDEVEVSFPCPLCTRTYKLEKELERHLRANHSALRQRTLAKYSRDNQCFKAAVRKQRLPYECMLSSKHQECEQCGKLYRSERHLRKHKCSKNNILEEELLDFNQLQTDTAPKSSSPMTSDRTYVPPDGTKTTSIPSKASQNDNFLENAVKSLPSLSETYPFSCDKCGRAYKWKKTLDRHTRVNHNPLRPHRMYNIKPKVNITTEEILLSPPALDIKSDPMHEIIDENLLNYSAMPDDCTIRFPCTQCDGIYRSQRALWNHIRLSHKKQKEYVEVQNEMTEDYPFACQLCARSYKLEKMLQRHMRINHTSCITVQKTELHTTENEQFPCPHCTRHYKRKKTLVRHMRLSHNYPRSKRSINAQLKALDNRDCENSQSDEMNELRIDRKTKTKTNFQSHNAITNESLRLDDGPFPYSSDLRSYK